MMRSCAVLLLLSCAATAQFTVPTGFTVEPVFNSGPFPGNQPVDLEILPDGRILVVTKGGGMVVIADGVMATVGTLPDIVNSGPQGIAGLALDPSFVTNGFVYVYYTPASVPFQRLSRFELVGDLTDPASTNLVLTDEHLIFDMAPNNHDQHHGGGLIFAPDGTLLLAMGDDRADCTATDPTTLSGVIVRLDVSNVPTGPGGPPPLASITPADNPFVASTDVEERLVIAWGLRNPWSLDVDPVTNTLYIGEVGNGLIEEVDCYDLDPTTGLNGANYGWPEMEGSVTRSPCMPGNAIPPTDHVAPIFELTHANGAVCNIMGGLYRKTDRLLDFGTDYDGDLFFADWGNGKLHRIERDMMTGTWSFAAPVPGQPAPDAWGTGFFGAVRFEQGADGALYFLTSSPHGVSRIRPDGLDHEIVLEPTLAVPGSVDIVFRGVGGAPGNSYFHGIAVDSPGVAPNGWFFGIDMTLLEIQQQIGVFFGVFDTVGEFDLRIPLGAFPNPVGITFDAVVLEFGAGGTFVGQGPAKTITI